MLEKSGKIDVREGGWMHVDVRKLLISWFRNPEENFGLVVEAFDFFGNKLNIDRPSEGDLSTVSSTLNQAVLIDSFIKTHSFRRDLSLKVKYIDNR